MPHVTLLSPIVGVPFLADPTIATCRRVHLFGWLTIDQVIRINPAATVHGLTHFNRHIWGALRVGSDTLCRSDKLLQYILDRPPTAYRQAASRHISAQTPSSQR